MNRSVQASVHVLEGILCLGKEIVDYAFAEIAFFLVVIHLEDLASQLIPTRLTLSRADPLTCSKVAGSMLSPNPGNSVEPSSDCT